MHARAGPTLQEHRALPRLVRTRGHRHERPDRGAEGAHPELAQYTPSPLRVCTLLTEAFARCACGTGAPILRDALRGRQEPQWRRRGWRWRADDGTARAAARRRDDSRRLHCVRSFREHLLCSPRRGFNPKLASPPRSLIPCARPCVWADRVPLKPPYICMDRLYQPMLLPWQLDGSDGGAYGDELKRYVTRAHTVHAIPTARVHTSLTVACASLCLVQV